MQGFSFRSLFIQLASAAVLLTLGASGHAFAEVAPRLVQVVDGEIWQAYGETAPIYSAGQPIRSRGIVYLTAAKAEVTAPANGFVEYAGPVDGMGQAVILNIGNDYRVVLTGLSKVSVKTGDIVPALGTIGTMPAAAHAPSHLYMELRHGEEPVNPFQAAPVLAMQ